MRIATVWIPVFASRNWDDAAVSDRALRKVDWIPACAGMTLPGAKASVTPTAVWLPAFAGMTRLFPLASAASLRDA